MQQHVVALPYPAQGHITPMLQLCRQLARYGFTFTFINTQHIHQRVQRARPSSSGHEVHLADSAIEHPDDHIHSNCEKHRDALDTNKHEQRRTHGECSSIRMVFIPGGGAPEDHARQSTWANAYKAADNMQKHVEQLLSQIMLEQAVSFYLSDIMFSWSASTAHKFSLPWLAFWPAFAAACSTFLYFSDLATEGKGVPIAGKQVGDVGSTIIEDIPGLPPTRLCELHKVWDTSTGKVQHPVLRSFQQLVAVEETSYLIMNTFEELEGRVLEALRKRLPVIAVGPLLPWQYLQLPDAAGAARGPEAPMSLFPEDHTCLAWLDTQAPSSVLFISFGSISLRTERQLRELALGVEASGCPFLWVRRPAIDTCQDPDEGQYGGAAHDGLIVPWAPQLQVLSHPSVGGFITHCGWNSVMESVAMGVPMLCWADTGERMMNERYVVEFWESGIHMVAGDKRVTQHIDDAVLVGRAEVENSVRQLMYEETGAPIRARAAQLRAISREASVAAGSRFKELVEAMELKSCAARANSKVL